MVKRRCHVFLGNGDINGSLANAMIGSRTGKEGPANHPALQRCSGLAGDCEVAHLHDYREFWPAGL